MSLKDRLSLLKTTEVEVRGEKVGVAELTAGQRESLLGLFQSSPVKAMAAVCAMCARDENGEAFLTPEDAETLPPDVVDTIAGAALKLSGMGDDSPND
jgi:hypothetical protein